jgi:hypothetical protein
MSTVPAQSRLRTRSCYCAEYVVGPSHSALLDAARATGCDTTALLAFATVADVASIVTGLTTIALVVVTYTAVRSGRASAEAAAVSAGLAARELQEAHRPVLIPEPPAENGPELVIAVRNIGVGPALRVFGRAQARDLPPTVVGRFPLHPLSGLAAGNAAELRFRGVALPNLLSLKIVFDDVLGKTYTTDARWDGVQKAFVHAGIAEGDSARVPVKISVSEEGITVGSDPSLLIKHPPDQQEEH